ncbi:flagellar protein FlgJ [Formivibrio citricus]|uniref:Peptidoglycan hydrolase FlgJ n=1 Tax=Formivibrio citricus TaxID=83765 RepID=A0A1I4ZWA2_9NEIS|nr:flagellar assembly peptidoglycan hydrolase FlgJ [Formivibrio citricus]SFN54506.1 flagellar protein FlgJ [Formivibrio citricus]
MAISSNFAVAQEKLALDPQGVESLRRAVRNDSEAGAKAVARQFEALLVQQMLSSMRQANQGFGEESHGAFGLFRSMQDQQFAQLTAMKGGAGLADAIVRQINAQRSAASTGKQATSRQTSSETVATAKEKVMSEFAVGVSQPAKPAASTAAPAGDFIGKLSASAEKAANDLGISPRLLLAQAALETGWGKRAIRNADGSDSHNLFGIKAGKNWTGKTTDVTTTEYVDGKAQKRVEKFRSYDSYAAAFSDYANLIKRRYGNAVGLGNDATGFGQALQVGGYATDPGYAGKIAKVADRVSAKLAAYQSGSSQTA